MNYQLLSHGFDHSQYFQGCGVSFTSFQDVVTGAGGCEKEAFEDALEQMYMHSEKHGETAKEIEEAEKETIAALSEERDEEAEKEELNEIYYYFSIRYNLKPENAR